MRRKPQPGFPLVADRDLNTCKLDKFAKSAQISEDRKKEEFLVLCAKEESTNQSPLPRVLSTPQHARNPR
jgi:hypothetical protein